MLFQFCVVICLIHNAKGTDDEKIGECNKQVGMVQRPTVNPNLCAHLDVDACAAIFEYMGVAAGIMIGGAAGNVMGAAGTLLSHITP